MPILANRLMKSHTHVSEYEVNIKQKTSYFEWMRDGFVQQTNRLMRRNRLIVGVYLLIIFVLAGVGFVYIGKDILPQINSGQMVIRMKTPDGTRLERTEEKVKELLSLVDEVAEGNLAVSSAYVGVVPTNYATTNLYVSTSGSNDAVIKVALAKEYHANIQDFKERLREAVKEQMPSITLSFEPADLTEKLMSQGAYTPIEVQVAGREMAQIESYANQLVGGLAEVPFAGCAHHSAPQVSSHQYQTRPPKTCHDGTQHSAGSPVHHGIHVFESIYRKKSVA